MADERSAMMLRLPEPLMEAVRQRAEANKRSKTREIEVLLERALAPTPEVNDAR